MRRIVLTVLFVVAVHSVGTTAEDRPAPHAKPAFEVLVVGTLHAPWQFRTGKYHPGHVRAALEAAKPDVVGVESHPDWFAKGRFHVSTWEAQGVAVPWAKSRKIPVYGVDWKDIDAWDERAAARRKKWAEHLERMERKDGLGSWAFGKVQPPQFESAKKFFSKPDFDFHVMNDIGSDAYGQRWLRGAGKPGTPTFGGERNRKIAERCVEVMKRHPGKRLAVVVGAGHKAVLDAIFEARPDVRLLRWEKDVAPPTEAVAKAALTSEDRIAILGHNLDGERSYFHSELIDLDRMAGIVSEVKKDATIDPRIGYYFEARLLAHRGEIAKALSLLDKVLFTVKAPPPSPYPYPMDQWRMEYDLLQAARLEEARILLAGDEVERGRGILRKLADEMPEAEGEYGRGWKAAWLAKRYPLWLLEDSK